MYLDIGSNGFIKDTVPWVEFRTVIHVAVYSLLFQIASGPYNVSGVPRSPDMSPF